MASEATKISVKDNNHMDTMVIKVTGFKYEVKLDLWGCLEAAKSLKPPECGLQFFIALVDRSL